MLSKFFLIPVKDEADPDYKEEKKDIITPEERKIISEFLKKQPESKLDSTTKKDSSIPVTTTITNIKEKIDKNKNKFLLLETDNLPNNVFVFDYKIDQSR
jgi:hypothetical protein